MKISATQLRIILSSLIVLLVVGGAAGSYVVLQILRQQIRDVSHIKVDAEVSSEAEASAFKAKTELEKPEIAQLLQYTAEIIPPAEYRSQFLADIKKYADQSRVSIIGITFGDATAGAAQTSQTAISGIAATPVPITVSVGQGAAYQDFISFMKKLENNLQYVQIVNVNLQPDSTNTKLLANATLETQLYLRK